MLPALRVGRELVEGAPLFGSLPVAFVSIFRALSEIDGLAM
jgi:hypothetical protein